MGFGQIIASVGLDMKLYTFDTGSKKPSSSIHHEAPFSSLAYSDDGLTLAAGTTTGQVLLYDVRGKPQPVTVLHAYGNSEVIHKRIIAIFIYTFLRCKNLPKIP